MLAMIADTMIPEAFDGTHNASGLITALGFVTAFVFAMIAVRGLLKFIASHSYAVFAWYRIAFGMLILATWLFGWVNWTEAAAA